MGDSGTSSMREKLRALVDPVELALLSAPSDDEPLSEHERAAEEGSRRERRGEPLITHEDVLREFGLVEPDA